MGILQGRILEWVAMPSPRGSSHPGIEPRSPALPEDSLPSESPGKLENTGMGSLSLLPGIFPTQELNQDLLHCREVLYQLSYRGPLLTNICADISRNAYVSAFELLTFSVVTYISFTVITFIWEQVCIYKKRGRHVSAPRYPSWFQESTWFLKKLKGSNEVQW